MSKHRVFMTPSRVENGKTVGGEIVERVYEGSAHNSGRQQYMPTSPYYEGPEYQAAMARNDSGFASAAPSGTTQPKLSPADIPLLEEERAALLKQLEGASSMAQRAKIRHEITAVESKLTRARQMQEADQKNAERAAERQRQSDLGGPASGVPLEQSVQELNAAVAKMRRMVPSKKSLQEKCNELAQQQRDELAQQKRVAKSFVMVRGTIGGK